MIKKTDYNKPSLLRVFLFSKTGVFLALTTIIIPLSAFEAHVVNVTATIERHIAQCDALSIGYWSNNEGCDHGSGSSAWEEEAQRLSANQLSGLFSGTTGSEMCSALWIPDCPSGNSLDAKLCKAKAHMLADELNVVSGRLDLNALLAGADDGNSAFDAFGLSEDSTVRQALQAIEAAITGNLDNNSILTDSAYVAKRIYVFYENENPDKPFCVYDPNWKPPVHYDDDEGGDEDSPEHPNGDDGDHADNPSNDDGDEEENDNSPDDESENSSDENTNGENAGPTQNLEQEDEEEEE